MIHHIFSRVLLAGALGMPLLAQAAATVITVYKSEFCGCCEEWVKHLKANGFSIKTKNVANPSDYREKAGIPSQFGSCHTGIVGGYAVEGHVPAKEIKRLLKEKPAVKGLAVPAMPIGSPGMEGPRNDPFDVLVVQTNGRTAVYKHYN